MKKVLTPLFVLFLLAVFISCTSDDKSSINSENEGVTVENEIPKSSEKQITGFQFLASQNNGLSQSVTAIIDEETKIITATVSLNTFTNYLEALLPSIEISELATINPINIKDFTEPVIYTVTAEDGTSIDYEVFVTISEKDVLFSILAENGGVYPQDWVIKYANNSNISEWEGVTLNNGKVIELDLSSSRINVLSPRIKLLTNLEKINLNNNAITSIPPEIGKLSKLTSLLIGSNNLYENSIPPEISQLSNLNVLNLGNNKIGITSTGGFGSVPQEIAQLTALTALNLESNQLISIPSEIGQLINLTIFKLNDNHLTFIPQAICDLEIPDFQHDDNLPCE